MCYNCAEKPPVPIAEERYVEAVINNYSKSETPPSPYLNFDGCSDKLRIYVPDDAVDSYKSADGWSAYADKILPLSELP